MNSHQGSLSSVQLQAHYDEISFQMSVLPLSILPRPIASSLGTLDAAAVKLAKRAAAGLTECQVCSCSCSSPDQLHLLFTTRLEFHSRAVHATAAHFVCGQCAAVSNCSLLLQLATPRVGGEDDEQRSQQLLKLQLHFAALNNAPANITSNTDSLTLWVQELACRAYSMYVVANSLKGWKLQPEGASTAQILQQLLQPPAKKRMQVAAVAAGAVAGAGQRKKLSKGKHAGQVQEQEGPAAGSKRASSAQPAAQHAGMAGLSTGTKKHKKAHVQADEAAVQEPAVQPTPASMKQHHSSKKHKQAAAAPGSDSLVTPATGKQQSSSKKHKHAAAAAPGSDIHATPSGSKQHSSRQGVVADAGLRTPQHGKVKMSSSKKQKLLKSAPR